MKIYIMSVLPVFLTLMMSSSGALAGEAMPNCHNRHIDFIEFTRGDAQVQNYILKELVQSNVHVETFNADDLSEMFARTKENYNWVVPVAPWRITIRYPEIQGFQECANEVADVVKGRFSELGLQSSESAPEVVVSRSKQRFVQIEIPKNFILKHGIDRSTILPRLR